MRGSQACSRKRKRDKRPDETNGVKVGRSEQAPRGERQVASQDHLPSPKQRGTAHRGQMRALRASLTPDAALRGGMSGLVRCARVGTQCFARPVTRGHGCTSC